MPSTQKEIEWQWERTVQENVDFCAIRVNDTKYDFEANLDYFNLTDAKRTKFRLLEDGMSFLNKQLV